MKGSDLPYLDQKQKALKWKTISERSLLKIRKGSPFVLLLFSHPDYTVGSGIKPDHALRLVGYTTGRDSHPALKIFVRLKIV